jgi:uncharacterized protein with von Willebrand factor type A (vWA) domain
VTQFSGPASSMLDVLQGFVQELRAVGLPVSMTENLDAMRGVEHVDLGEREVLRATLAATLVKHARHRAAFDTAFDLYFSLHRHPAPLEPDSSGEPSGDPGGDAGDGATAGELSREEFAEMLLRALQSMDRDELRRLAGIAVRQFAGMEPGRPVGGTYYLYRTLRHMDLDELAARLMGDARALGEPGGALEERLLRDDFDARLRELRAMVEEEIRRWLVADRGPEAMARTLRKPLPEDVDFMHASREEMQAMQHAIEPLTRRLAARLAQRRRRRHHGHLDFRRTVRASMNYGGVPLEPKFRRPHPSKPEIMVVADISGSVASFARFTLQFVHAMASQFSRVRSWVFIDGIDEVTRFFEGAEDFSSAVQRVNTEADVVWVDGHSDYGHAFSVFHERHAREVTRKSSVIFLGDARNNYHPAHDWVLQSLQSRARHVYWLNPEPRAYWDTGDSIVSQYAKFCDGVFECRNLRQLDRFVATIADA